MIKARALFLALFLSFTIAVNAAATQPIEVAFSPRGGTTEAVINLIAEAKESIRLASYNFSSKDVAQALLEAHKRGVDVKVVLDRSNKTAKYSSATFLTNSGIPTRIDSKYPIMHSKFIVVDGVTVQTGSLNYTNAAEKNAENIIILRDNAEVARQYYEEWKRLWDESEPYERNN